MAWPTITCEISFASDPLTASPTWVDVSSYLRAWDIKRGRSSERSRVDAGTAVVVLSNRDRRFDPTYASSPYYPNVVPMRQIRLRATYNAVTYDLFRGFIESWPLRYSGGAKNAGDAVVELSCVDAFKLFSLFQVKAYSAEVLEDAPVAYWKLDDASGAATAADAGSNGQALTFAGSPTRAAGPLFGHKDVVDFDGTNDSATLTAPNAALKIAGDVTVEFWVRADSWASAPGIVVFEDTGAYSAYAVTIDGGGQAFITWGSVTGSVGSDLSSALSTGAWHHVVAVRDSGSARARIYLDGVLDIETVLPVPRASTTSGSLFVAARDLSSVFLDGRIAHVAIYNKVLSPDRIAAHYAAKVDALKSAASGTQLGALLDAFGWPSAKRNIDAGNSTIQEHTPSGSLLDALHAIGTDAENGIVFMEPDGDVGFHQRHAQWTGHGTALATFGDDGSELRYANIVPAFDDTELANVVRIERDGGTPQQVQNAASKTKYGPRTLEKTGLLIGTDSEALDAANYLLERFREPFLRIESLEISPERDPANLWPQVLGRDIHLDRITVKRRPPDTGTITQDEHIIGVEHRATASPREWRTTWRLMGADQFTYWLLGDATYGVLGTTTRLGY